MAKPIAKSIRISQEAYDIVEAAPGKGFNDKYENLIFDYHNTIPSRSAQLKELEKKIKQKKDQLKALTMIGDKVNHIIKELNQIAEIIPNISEELENVSREARQAATGLKFNEIQKYEQIEIHE